MTGGAQDSGAITRTMEREFWNGVPVVAYHWTIHDPECPIEGLRERPGIAYHWSTGPEDAARLISVADVEEYLSRATPAPAGWRPIESAPMDGRGIIVIDMTAPLPEAGQAWFKHGVWTAVCPDGAIALEAEVYRAMTWPTPTHWRPLPSPPLAGMDQAEPRYLVWSNEHKAWWGPEHRGYTRIIANAGRYDRDEALTIAGKRGGGWYLNKGNPDEIAIPEQDAIDQYADITRAQSVGGDQ